MMSLSAVPPAGWDAGLPFPTLSTGFAAAARALGHEPLYASNGDGKALVLTRAVAVPVLRRWTARSKVYVQSESLAFVNALVETLRARGVSHVRVGDAVWGWRAAAGAPMPMTAVWNHLMTFDARLGDDETLALMDPKTRAQIRKSERAGTVVEEVRDAVALDDFCRLADVTGERMRARDVAAVHPASYFKAVYRSMVPRGEAMFLVARAQGQPLAGGLFLLSPQRMSYYLGASTRDRALTTSHGPSALFWGAMRIAHKRGIPAFDLGAVTPTEDVTHPNHSVYQFKRRFGGQVERLVSAEVVLSPVRYQLQERVLMPLWKRFSDVYLAAATRGRGDAAA